MTKKRKDYDLEFKLNIAKMIVDQNIPVSQICSQFSIGDTAALRWAKQYQNELSGGAGIGKPLTAEQQRIRQLEAELRQLKQDNDLLKKASAFFARELK